MAIQARSLLTRQRLLDATVETLAEKGYHATSLPELCKRAGLSRGAQLHHFPTKQQLLSAAVEHVMERRHGELREMLRQKPARERAGAFSDALWSIYSGPTFSAWLELAVAARTDEELRRELARMNERFYDDAKTTLRELLPDGARRKEKDLAAMARFVTSFMNGVAVNRIPDDDDAQSLATLALFKQLVRALLTADAGARR